MILACPVLGPSAGLATMQVTAHGRGFRHPQPTGLRKEMR
jgi:hypothetical protein